MDGAPQVVRHAVNGNEHLVHMPLVAGARALVPQRIRVLLTELPAPPAHRLIRREHAPLGERLLDIAIAAREAAVQPHGATDDLQREPIAPVGGP